MNTGAALSQAMVDAMLGGIPYGRFLGVRGELRGDELTLVLPYREALVGNPLLPALHGGVIGAFMELAAIAQIAVSLREERLPKTIDVHIDYLRSGRPVDTYARATLAKLGRRIANAQVTCWQQEVGEPIAALRGHFMLITGQEQA
jgi:uncharacterized protein (TIGR00369 family)